MMKNLAILAILSMPLFAAEVINQPPNLNAMIQQAKDKGTVNANFKEIIFHRDFIEEMLPDLISSGLDGNYENEYQMTNFHWAVRKLSVKALELINQATPIVINRSNAGGRTILGDAVDYGKHAEARFLIERLKADINFRGLVTVEKIAFLSPHTSTEATIPGNCAIHYVHDTKMLDLLIEYGVDINAEGERKQNILFIPTFAAVQNGHLDVLRKLIEAKAATTNSDGIAINKIACGTCDTSKKQEIYQYVDSLL
jgi:mannitol/fructose-specific phosphotransferase system IIA component